MSEGALFVSRPVAASHQPDRFDKPPAGQEPSSSRTWRSLVLVLPLEHRGAMASPIYRTLGPVGVGAWLGVEDRSPFP